MGMKKEEEKPRTTLERQWKLWSQGRMLVMEISFGRAGLVVSRTRGSWGSRGTMVVDTS